MGNGTCIQVSEGKTGENHLLSLWEGNGHPSFVSEPCSFGSFMSEPCDERA